VGPLSPSATRSGIDHATDHQGVKRWMTLKYKGPAHRWYFTIVMLWNVVQPCARGSMTTARYPVRWVSAVSSTM
jgi:hypothetical protein